MSNLFLKNTATQWQSKSIDIDSAMMVLGSQTLDQAKNWFVFIDGEEQWKSILHCPLIVDRLVSLAEPKVEVKHESIQVPFEVPVDLALDSALRETTSPSLVQQEDVQPEIETQPEIELQSEVEPQPEPAVIEKPASTVFAAAQDIYEPVSNGEKRQHPRYEIRLRTIIKSGKNTYLTYSQDVSLGGLCLINDVPEYIFNSEAEIYITAPDGKNNIMFTCMPIKTKLGKSRLMFTKVDASKMKIFEAWVHHFVRPSARKVS